MACVYHPEIIRVCNKKKTPNLTYLTSDCPWSLPCMGNSSNPSW